MNAKFPKILLISLVFVIVPGWVLADLPAKALAEAGDLATTCQQISSNDNSCQNLTAADCKALLEKCADYYDSQSADIAKDITKTQQQKNTLQNQIAALRKKVKGLELKISQGNLMVKDLNLKINDTQTSISKTTLKIQSSQNQIASILRTIYEENQKPSVVILLEGNLSDFFGNLARLESLNSRLSDLLQSTTDLKSYLEEQRKRQENEKGQLQKTIQIQSLQKQENEQNKKQQENYLKLTEEQYQQQLQEKKEAEKNAAKIKARLFQIVGVTKVPTFGEALEVAKAVSRIINIRPAFLLAIISQESAIGRNVGQCMLTDVNTGAGKRILTGAIVYKIFNIYRDLQPFLQITSSVGRDPLNSPVSCDGYGSMGPAQFLPSTWNKFADRLQSLLDVTADPWGVKDSFTAAALYLSNLGAGAQTLTAEKRAAYSYNGSGWHATVYSRQVMTRAQCIQGFIDRDTMSTECQNLIF